MENVLPTSIEWGPTLYSLTPSLIPERIDNVRAPPRDLYGRLTEPEQAIDTTTGHPLVPAVLWIGTHSRLLQPSCRCRRGRCYRIQTVYL